VLRGQLEGNTVLSSSRDGTSIVFSLRSGAYVRTLRHAAGTPVDLVGLSPCGHVAQYSLSDGVLHALTINHRHAQPPLASVRLGERLHALLYTRGAEALLHCGEGGTVTLRRPHDLSPLATLHARTDDSPGGPGPLRCLALSANEECLYAGSHRGTLLVWSLPCRMERNVVDALDYLAG
jgi:WD40 repeat protein